MQGSPRPPSQGTGTRAVSAVDEVTELLGHHQQVRVQGLGCHVFAQVLAETVQFFQVGGGLGKSLGDGLVAGPGLALLRLSRRWTSPRLSVALVWRRYRKGL
jgi:hypothetical protein